MVQEGFKRKLTAILSADVEGYSRLMDENEDTTIRTLTTYRNAIAKLVQQYRGRASALKFGTPPCANQERHRLVRSCLAGKEDRNRP